MERRGRFYPEQGNRQPPRGMERRGGIRLNVTGAPTRPDGVIAPERPAPPRIQPRPEPTPQKVPEKPKKHTGRNIALATTALGALGPGAYEAYQNVPAIHQMVDQAFLFHLRGDQLVSTDTTAKPVEKFDNTARSGIIRPNDLTDLSKKELDKLDSLAKIDDRNTVQAIYPIDISTSNKPDAKIKYKKTYAGNGNEQDRINRAEQGFLNVFDFESVPAGSTIRAPVDGRLVVYTWSGNPTPINDHDFITATIDFLVNGEEYRLIISGGSKDRGIRRRADVFRSLTDAPITGSNMSPSEKIEIKRQAIPIKRGDPIMQVADKEVNITFFMRGSIDMSKLDKWKFKEEVIDGKTVRTAMEDPTNLELFLSNGSIAAPAPTKQN